jgi:hypothetical protein
MREQLNRSQEACNKRSKLVASALSSSVEEQARRNEFIEQRSKTVKQEKGDYVGAPAHDRALLLEPQPYRRPTYYQNLMHSPLLNFSKFPQAILKRLTSRGRGAIGTSEGSSRKNRRDVEKFFH